MIIVGSVRKISGLNQSYIRVDPGMGKSTMIDIQRLERQRFEHEAIRSDIQVIVNNRGKTAVSAEPFLVSPERDSNDRSRNISAL